MPSDAVDRRLERLPAWARDEITKLRRQVESLTELLEEASKGSKGHPLSYTDTRSCEAVIYLPEYANLKAHRGNRNAMNIEPVADGVTLRADYGRIVIHPHSDNVATVYAHGPF